MCVAASVVFFATRPFVELWCRPHLTYESQPNYYFVETYQVLAGSVHLQLLVVVAGFGAKLLQQVTTSQKQG